MAKNDALKSKIRPLKILFNGKLPLETAKENQTLIFATHFKFLLDNPPPLSPSLDKTRGRDRKRGFVPLKHLLEKGIGDNLT